MWLFDLYFTDTWLIVVLVYLASQILFRIKMTFQAKSTRFSLSYHDEKNTAGSW